MRDAELQTSSLHCLLPAHLPKLLGIVVDALLDLQDSSHIFWRLLLLLLRWLRCLLLCWLCLLRLLLLGCRLLGLRLLLLWLRVRTLRWWRLRQDRRMPLALLLLLLRQWLRWYAGMLLLWRW
jgi:hypothetical protein